MNQPLPEGLYNGWPRQTCPTMDDADGLRFLYPECDELLPCEMRGGREHRTEVNQSWGPGCRRFIPADNHYSIVDYSGARTLHAFDARPQHEAVAHGAQAKGQRAPHD